jgi:hypothetical protein
MKKTIKLTLENTATLKVYFELRDEMVEDMVNIEMDAPTPQMLQHYEEMLFEFFRNMDDDDLQAHHDKHIEFFEQRDEPSTGEVLAEYAEELRAEGKDDDE